MLRVHLSPPDHAAVPALRRDPSLSPHERDWVEIVLLSATGWSPPRIAAHLRCHPETVRRLLKRFQQDGVSALRQRRTGPPRDLARRQQVLLALDGLLDQDRTWSARQLAAALTEQGITLSARQTRRYLSGMRARWRRTARTLKHKQDPVRAARAAYTLAAFKKSPGRHAAAGLRLFVDECGFAPSQPVSYTWVRAGERKRIPYENPQGRRLNTLAALVPDGPSAALYWVTFPGTFRADQIVRLCEELPPVPVPTVVVLDNASIHTSHSVRAARPALRARRTFLYYLPPYSPELNDIERLFRTVKDDDLPERRYPSIPLLDSAVQQAFTTAEERLLIKHGLLTQPQHEPRLAA